MKMPPKTTKRDSSFPKIGAGHLGKNFSGKFDDDTDEDDDDDFDDDDDDVESEEAEPEINEKNVTATVQSPKDRKTLFIKNIPDSITENDIRTFCPDVVRVHIDVSHLKSEAKTKYAIMDFEDGDSAARALLLLKGKQIIEGVDVIVDYIGGKGTDVTYKSPMISSTTDLLKLYVTGFGRDITMELLKDMFPTASDITLPLSDSDGNKPVGYAFVHYADEILCKAAHDSMQDHVYQSRTLVVMFSKKSTPMDPAKREQIKRKLYTPSGRGPGRPKKVRTVAPEPQSDEEEDEEEEEEEQDEDDEDEEDDEDDDYN